MKKSWLLVCLILLFATAASAIDKDDMTVSVDAVSSTITDLQKGYAEFNVSVKNNGDETETFRFLYLDPPNWYATLLPDPASKDIKLAPGDTGSYHMYVKPSSYKEETIGIRAMIRAVDSNFINNDAILRVKVGKPNTPEVPPDADFDVTVSVPAQMDPRGTYNVVVSIQNNNKRLLDGVNIKLDSTFVSDDTNVTVQPNESKSISFAVLLMDNIKPQKDQLQVTVNYNGEEFYSQAHNFEVVKYVLPFDTSIDVEKRFLKEVRTITITNKGNALKEDTVRIETSLKEKFFSSSLPKFGSVKEDGKYYFTWDVSLEPDASTTIVLTTSYRLLLLLALVIIALLAYKIAMSNPLVVKKKMISVNKQHGGAISDLSVVILLRNRSKEHISKLRVIERVSPMVKLKTDSFAGSMHPVKMHEHDREGTLLEYRFGELAPGDERIIKYRVYSKLHIFGTLTIKPTVVEFFKKNNAKKTSRSRAVSISTDEPVKKQDSAQSKPKAHVHAGHGHEHGGHHEHPPRHESHLEKYGKK
ncbi:hypothetical protein KY363_00125 [Candidatus Woesearchaeota archaeon]|nr:hypothetical protein [Candidatus Woesearchaeota archaeon]